MSTATTTAPETPWTSASWRAAFRANAEGLLDIPWDRGAGLSGAERAVITRSIRAFQLGESSEGRHLLRRAREYAARAGDADYPGAVALFIAEEQRHARDLGRFLDLAGIPRLRAHWVDAVFRGLRRPAGLGLMIVVLITAEIIAKVYYKALREATGSVVLRRICDQILRDEAEHVRFQAERIALLRVGWSRRRRKVAVGLHRLFLAGTCLVIWRDHGSTIEAGGLDLAGFRRSCLREFDAAALQMGPTSDAPMAAPLVGPRPTPGRGRRIWDLP